MNLIQDFMSYFRNRNSPNSNSFLINIVTNFLESIKQKEDTKMPIISILKTIIEFIVQFDPQMIKKAETQRLLWEENRKLL
jgi:hypothetical protein